MDKIITITRQDSLAIQKFSKNHIQKAVHAVAKNIPFTIQVGSSSSINLQDKNTKLYAKLYYDSENEGDQLKIVDYLKHEPMTYKVFNDSPSKATLEIRVLVLSSKHEDCNFRIKIGVTSPKVEGLKEATSEPIRCISKANSVHTDKKKRTSPIISDTPTPRLPTTPYLPSPSPSPSTTAASGTKRNSDSLVLESLKRLEEQQREQRKIIEQLLVAPKMNIPDPQEVDFETAFANFLAAYNRLPVEERSSKVRKVLETTTTAAPSAVDNLSEFMLLCTDLPCDDSHSFSKVPININELLADVPTNNATDGVSRSELDAWDNLYSELTWSPESDSL